jgi:hypothetical protein
VVCGRHGVQIGAYKKFQCYLCVAHPTATRATVIYLTDATGSALSESYLYGPMNGGGCVGRW